MGNFFGTPTPQCVKDAVNGLCEEDDPVCPKQCAYVANAVNEKYLKNLCDASTLTESGGGCKASCLAGQGDVIVYTADGNFQVAPPTAAKLDVGAWTSAVIEPGICATFYSDKECQEQVGSKCAPDNSAVKINEDPSVEVRCIQAHLPLP